MGLVSLRLGDVCPQELQRTKASTHTQYQNPSILGAAGRADQEALETQSRNEGREAPR